MLDYVNLEKLSCPEKHCRKTFGSGSKLHEHIIEKVKIQVVNVFSIKESQSNAVSAVELSHKARSLISICKNISRQRGSNVRDQGVVDHIPSSRGSKYMRESIT